MTSKHAIAVTFSYCRHIQNPRSPKKRGGERGGGGEEEEDAEAKAETLEDENEERQEISGVTALKEREHVASESFLPVSSSQGLTSKTIMDFVSLAFSAALFLAASTTCVTPHNPCRFVRILPMPCSYSTLSKA